MNFRYVQDRLVRAHAPTEAEDEHHEAHGVERVVHHHPLYAKPLPEVMALQLRPLPPHGLARIYGCLDFLVCQMLLTEQCCTIMNRLSVLHFSAPSGIHES